MSGCKYVVNWLAKKDVFGQISIWHWKKIIVRHPNTNINLTSKTGYKDICAFWVTTHSCICNYIVELYIDMVVILFVCLQRDCKIRELKRIIEILKSGKNAIPAVDWRHLSAMDPIYYRALYIFFFSGFFFWNRFNNSLSPHTGN